ncbi:pyridoxamine 5'-phosphate oxidase family protein [Micromonospora endophytica]|nr:pyridoxamine 5'-phosphate oxidase family protein [Micromonospora endophytica]BCJ61115.1 general stress protein [Micromonospora endophytica]
MDHEAMNIAERRRQVTGLIRAARVCTLTTIALDGRLTGRPMLLQQADFDGELWFFAHADSSLVRQLRVNPEVAVGFGMPQERCWVSLSGTARDEYQRDRADWLWQPGLSAWFPNGPETTGLTLIAVHVTATHLWE